MKFRRKDGLSGPHPEGLFGIGVHALCSEPMSLEQIMEEHIKYNRDYPDTGVPTWGELIRDLGLMIMFNIVEAIDDSGNFGRTTLQFTKNQCSYCGEDLNTYNGCFYCT